MLFSNKRFIFLTFSDIAIKAVLIDLATKKPKIIFTDQKTLPEGVVFDEKVVDFVRFKEEVRNLLIRNKTSLKTKEIIFGINEQEVFFHKLDLAESNVGNQEAISKFLTENLPFPPAEASVKYLQKVKSIVQIVSAKTLVLQDLASIFENIGFELVSLAPVPLACLSLLSKEIEPYLFVLSEDQSLQFALVVKQTIVFSASLKLVKTVESSKTLITKTIKNLIEVEYLNHKKEHLSLRNIFVVGHEAEIIKIYLADENLKVETVDLLKKFDAEDTSDLVNYHKNLLLSFSYDDNLNFAGKKFLPGISEANKINVKSVNFRSLGKITAIFLGAILILLVINLVSKNLLGVIHTKKAPVTVTRKFEKIASKSASAAAKKIVVVPPVQAPPPTINKQDYVIEVLNGTNVTGLAGKTKTFLTTEGYNVIATGNADSNNYDQTVIQIKASKEAILADLTSTLSERYSVIRGDNLAESNRFDIIIFVGRK